MMMESLRRESLIRSTVQMPSKKVGSDPLKEFEILSS
jgi:hypothetical protein